MKNAIIILTLSILCESSYAANEAEQTPLSGFYAGLQAGFLINSVTLKATHVGFEGMSGVCNSNGNFFSFAPGAQVGYVHDFSPGFMLGLEADFTYHVNQQGNLACQCPTTPDVSDKFVFLNRMQGSLRGRFGYAVTDKIIPFLTAGASLADLALSYSNENGDAYATESAQIGWLVGAGLEWKMTCHWSLRGEYQFVGYTNVGLKIPTIYALTDPNGSAQASSFSNNFRFAVNYWF